jgi:hypothetical protein
MALAEANLRHALRMAFDSEAMLRLNSIMRDIAAAMAAGIEVYRRPLDFEARLRGDWATAVVVALDDVIARAPSRKAGEGFAEFQARVEEWNVSVQRRFPWRPCADQLAAALGPAVVASFAQPAH